MKLCPSCRQPAESSPCPSCKRKANRARGSAASRGYDAAWSALSKRARREQPWCSACGSREDLTVDHRVPLAVTGVVRGLTLDDVQVLCRRCNSSKGARFDVPWTHYPYGRDRGSPGSATQSRRVVDEARRVGPCPPSTAQNPRREGLSHSRTPDDDQTPEEGP